MQIRQILIGSLFCGLYCGVPLQAQRGGSEWTTSGGNAQRTSSFPDSAISPANMQKPGFRMLWKLKLNNQSRQMNALTGAVTAGTGYHYRGVNFLALMGGSSNSVFAVDYDMAQLYWEKHFDAPPPAAGTLACPGGMTAGITRSVNLAPPSAPVSRGSGAGVRSVSGAPGEGVPTEPRAGRGGPPAGVSGAQGRGGRGGRGGSGAPGRGGGGGFGSAQAVFAVTSDGVLHTISFPSSKELQKPIPFVPANARLSDLALVNDVVFTSTSNDCGGVANGVWSMNLADQSVKSWKTGGGSPVGDLAFGTDGTIYAALGPGAGYGNAVVALDPDTLKLKDWFTAPEAAFVTGPVVIHFQNQELVAAATRDGRIFLLDSQSLGGGSHDAPLASSAGYSSPHNDFVPEGLAAWQDENGSWLAMPVAGTPTAAAKSVASNGAVAAGAIVSMKITAPNGKPQLTGAWMSRDMNSPLTPVVVNGVMFATSGGEFHGEASLATTDRVKRSVPAILYALDAATGRELWNSGKSIASFMHSGTLSVSPGQLYLSTADSTFYSFGFPVDRE